MKEYLTSLLESFVAKEDVAGVNVLVTKDLEPLYQKSLGFADLENRTPMAPDTIFRIFSMSKVITSVCMLILYERGLYKMYDPVEVYLPGFKNQQVASEGLDGRITLTPAARPVAIRDLFTMTSGIPYGNEIGYVARRMQELFEDVAAKEGTGQCYDTVSLANAIGQVPLCFQPGAHWMYGLSTDILGALVEVIDGRTLGKFMREEIFEPLDMRDTGFKMPAEKQGRIAKIYEVEQGYRVFDAKSSGMCELERIESGGGGLMSTAADYTRLCQMLLMGGTLDGQRILGRKTVDLMRTNHLTDEQRRTSVWESQRGYGYGLTVRVLQDRAAAGSNGSGGEFGWDGMPGTYMCIDPVEKLTAVYLVGRIPGAHADFIPRFTAAMYAML